jgi:TfoX/Sxy family transcriptional regulator of competence genes
MMKWRKSPESLVQLFDRVAPTDPRVQRRSMFGYPAAFVNGHMFCGLHQENVIVRLEGGARSAFLALPGAQVFEPMPGRPMREYLVAPEAMVADEAELARWMRESLAYVATLPPKAGASAKAKRAATPAAKRPARARAPKAKKPPAKAARGRRGR